MTPIYFRDIKTDQFFRENKDPLIVYRKVWKHDDKRFKEVNCLIVYSRIYGDYLLPRLASVNEYTSEFYLCRKDGTFL